MHALHSVNGELMIYTIAADAAEQLGEVERAESYYTAAWRKNLRFPELLQAMDATVVSPAEYNDVRAGLMELADPRTQPSLDAWLRTHSHTSNFGLVFRTASQESQG